MTMSDRATYWEREKAKIVPLSLSFVLSMSVLGVFAQEEAVASQKVSPDAVETTAKPSASVVDATPKPAPNAADATAKPTASLVDATAKPSANGSVAAGLNLPLNNIELLDRMDDDRLPTRPRRFLKLRFKQVRRARDEQILQLLLICVGFVGVFVAILALRSVPPSRPGT